MKLKNYVLRLFSFIIYKYRNVDEICKIRLKRIFLNIVNHMNSGIVVLYYYFSNSRAIVRGFILTMKTKSLSKTAKCFDTSQGHFSTFGCPDPIGGTEYEK